MVQMDQKVTGKVIGSDRRGSVIEETPHVQHQQSRYGALLNRFKRG
jgi:hypothetical protein